MKGSKRLNKLLIFFIIIANVAFSQYVYSKQDLNSTSSSYGEMVWQPTYNDYITLHYFTTQGWAGWTSIFGQLSDFQEELHAEGYDKVVIIGVGHSAQQNFNSNFCANSNLPLIVDQSPNLPIYEAFGGEHRELVVIDTDGITVLYRQTLNSTYFPLYADNFREVIISNYPSNSMEGDVNSDEIVNILDIIQLVNMILSGEYADNADLNSDGMVNILDIIQIANIILSNE